MMDRHESLTRIVIERLSASIDGWLITFFERLAQYLGRACNGLTTLGDGCASQTGPRRLPASSPTSLAFAAAASRRCCEGCAAAGWTARRVARKSARAKSRLYVPATPAIVRFQYCSSTIRRCTKFRCLNRRTASFPESTYLAN